MPAHDPQVRRASSKLAATVRWHPAADTSALAEDLARARRDADIAKMVETWPPLSAAQRDRLALLLRPWASNGQGS